MYSETELGGKPRTCLSSPLLQVPSMALQATGFTARRPQEPGRDLGQFFRCPAVLPRLLGMRAIAQQNHVPSGLEGSAARCIIEGTLLQTSENHQHAK